MRFEERGNPRVLCVTDMVACCSILISPSPIDKMNDLPVPPVHWRSMYVFPLLALIIFLFVNRRTCILIVAFFAYVILDL